MNLTNLEKAFLSKMVAAQNEQGDIVWSKSWDEQDNCDIIDFDYFPIYIEKVQLITGIPMKEARGVISSLIKKGIVTFVSRDNMGLDVDELHMYESGFIKAQPNFLND